MTTPAKVFLSALGLGIAFDYFFFDLSRVGVNLPVAEILFLTVSLLLARWTGHVLPVRAWVAAGFAVAFSAVFAVWTGSLGLTVTFFGCLISNLLFIVFALGHRGDWRHPFEILSAGTLELGWKLFSRLSIVRELRIKRLASRESALIKGLVVLIPILLIFIALFASADLLFRVFSDEVFMRFNIIFEPDAWLGHVLFVGFWSMFFSSIFAAAFWQRFVHPETGDIKPRFILESQVIVGGTAVLFVSFLLVQGYALFGGEAAFAQMVSVTYAEYARQGFFQLVIVALLVIGLVLTLRRLHGEATSKWLIAMQTILIGETLLVLFSAFMRLNLYTDAYGYTPERLFGYWVMGTLGFLLLMLLVSVVRAASQSTLMRHGLIVLGIAGLLFSWTPQDELTVRLNIQKHEACQQTSDECRVDATLFPSLSEEAYPAIKAFLDAAQENDVQGFSGTCEDQYQREMLGGSFYQSLYDMGETTLGFEWQEWNWARKRLPDYYMDDPVPPAWLQVTGEPDCP
ncbi:DUF4173 domain-containing protein [Candidatus Uhrbacteria bacterium]|nr:DUF4173 domain-containing protein [Candidatus Uhrbacteria bacterium]